MVSSDQVFHFGTFSLYPSRRLLVEDGRPVHLGARALDLLVALVERPGEVIPKEELFQRVWPRTYVEETSLRVHIAALRKALGGPGATYIANIPGKGYSFTGNVSLRPVPGAAAPRTPPKHNLPVRLTRMIGRSIAARRVTSDLLMRRFVTITGEGGVGKTTLALAVAEANLEEYTDGVAFVDLAACTTPSLVVGSVGRALGLVLPESSGEHQVCAALDARRFLLVIDNCEHLVAESADLVTTLLKRLPVLRVLATSREPLRAEGECVHRLEALPVPPAGGGVISAEAALEYDAVQLLVERVSAATDGFVLTDADVPAAVELCRSLDGIPLAIELAAARVGFFGLSGLVSRLNDRMNILSSGHRTVMQRHRTLRALYDWSFDMLTEQAQMAYTSLGVFPGSFSLDAALAMMPCAERSSALPIFLELISKSLVAADVQGEGRRYRLLDSARVYATEKLAVSGNAASARKVHANWLVKALHEANSEWEFAARGQWIAQHVNLAEDIRCALDWLRHDPLSTELYARVLDAAYLLFQEMSQLELLRAHLAAALTLLRREANRDPGIESRLAAMLGEALSQSGSRPPEAAAWLGETSALLEQPDASPDVIYAALTLRMQHGEYRQMLRLAERLELAGEYSGDGGCVRAGRRCQAIAHHYLGDLRISRALAEQTLEQQTPTPGRVATFDNFDGRVPLGIVLARASWIEGNGPEAMYWLEFVRDQVESASERLQCHFLTRAAVPICIWIGDLDRASEYLADLQRLVDRSHVDAFWRPWAAAFARILDGRVPAPEVQSAKLLDLLSVTCPDFDSPLALERARNGTSGWGAPETLRNHGERLRDQSPDEAERLFRKALELARTQGATRWELRAAISLLRHEVARGRDHLDEQAVLEPLARLQASSSDADVADADDLVRKIERLRRSNTGC